jgi:hypothetical protein
MLVTALFFRVIVHNGYIESKSLPSMTTVSVRWYKAFFE